MKKLWKKIKKKIIFKKMMKYDESIWKNNKYDNIFVNDIHLI